MRNQKILYVDDEEQIRKLLSNFLARRGYQVTTAQDGLDALDLLGDELPDLLITDVDMPRCDGLELTRRLRSDTRTSHLPIIVLSAKAQTQDVLTGYAEGADEYVPKPIELAILGAKVETLLRRAKASASALRTPAQRLVGVPSRPERGQVITFLHGKGGVGATTLATNAAAALAANGQRVFLVDLNLEFGDVVSLLGLEALASVADFASHAVSSLDDDIFSELAVEHRSGVKVIVGAGHAEQAKAVSGEVVEATLERLRDSADYVFVDMPPTFSEVNFAALRAADLIAVVTAGRLVALNATAICLSSLSRERIGHERTIVLLNHPTSRGLKPDRVASYLNRQPDVVVPNIAAFADGGASVKPPFENSPDSLGAIVARDLAARITGVLATAA